MGRYRGGLLWRSRHSVSGSQLPAGGRFKDRHRGRCPDRRHRHRPYPRSADCFASGRLRCHSRCRAEKSVAADRVRACPRSCQSTADTRVDRDLPGGPGRSGRRRAAQREPVRRRADQVGKSPGIVLQGSVPAGSDSGCAGDPRSADSVGVVAVAGKSRDQFEGGSNANARGRSGRTGILEYDQGQQQLR